MFSNDVYNQLLNSGYDFNNKLCLDIGTRDGLNCIQMIKLGSRKVIGIDIEDNRFNEMPKDDNIELIKVNILDYNSSELFDVITCFLWNIPVPIYDDVMTKIKSLLKPSGTIFIGIYDRIYKYGYRGIPNTGSVIELITNNFKFYRIIDKTSPFQWIIRASD
jgi:2-polyprenyl-3-methyl-5-hydroxy-6-metoxy-1,4-benzoquinol methylase